jgi:O-antigen/teichoic acid export membrane protein
MIGSTRTEMTEYFLASQPDAPMLGQLLRIPLELRVEFSSLMGWQCAVTGAGFLSKILQHLLIAQHRYEVNNYVQAASFGLNLALLWLFFDLGWKLASLPVANGICWVFSSLATLVTCYKLGVFPQRGHWGRLKLRLLRDMLVFGRDVFLVTIGAQLILASQTIIITRTMGLEASAVWSVCTKTYSLISQLVWRIYDYSGSAFVEMIVRGERQRLRERFREMVMVTASASALAGILFSICNQPFIALWTSGRITWSGLNDLLLGVWLVIVSVLRCHTGLVLLTKRVGFMRYIYFIEGIVFFLGANVSVNQGGFPAMILTSIVCSLCFTGAYGVWRTTDYLQLSLLEVFVRWLAPMFQFAAVVIPIAVLAWVGLHGQPVWWQLSGYAFSVGISGIILFLRFGLAKGTQREIFQRVPVRMRPLVGRVFRV